MIGYGAAIAPQSISITNHPRAAQPPSIPTAVTIHLLRLPHTLPHFHHTLPMRRNRSRYHGAVASAHVAHQLMKTGDQVVVHTAGGCLRVLLGADGVAFMEGGAVRVYEGRSRSDGRSKDFSTA